MARKVKLTKSEKMIEADLLKGSYAPIGKQQFEQIAKAVASRKKDSVISLRVNSEDLTLLKKKAAGMGIKYQSFLSELIHRVAHS